MARYKGVITAGIQPLGFTGDNLKNLSYNWRANYVKSANTPLRYQVMWNGLDDNQEPSKANFNAGNNKGDIINMVFRVYASTQYPYPVSSDDWDLVATIKKTRDIANKSYIPNAPIGAERGFQRYTIDISQLCQDLLSYSLVPINKGTWQSSEWGGMNGGETKQDNITVTVSDFNVTRNGTYRHIMVKAIPEVILANGTIEEVVGQNPIQFNKIAVINSVAQFEKDSIYYNLKYIIQKSAANVNNPRGFMSLCPNYTQTTNSPFLKQVREDEEAEWLYWWQRNMGNSGDQTTKARLKVETYLSNGSLQNTMYLSDFNSNLDKETVSNLEVFKLNQNRVCVQNVSPVYINANAQDDGGNSLTNQIDSNTSYYRTHLEYINAEDNIITNGTFDTDTDWGKGTGWSINTSSKIAECDGSQVSGTQLTQTGLSFTNGVTYRITYTLTVTAGSVKAAFRGGTGVDGVSRTSSGTYTENMVALTGNNSFRMIANTDFIGTVDNISVQANPTAIRPTEYRYFGIDRETANVPFGFVRFHWLNRIGGIDSYTAKRNVTEGLSVKRDTIETKSADRTWYQDNQYGDGTSVLNSDYISNTMRGGNLYKGGQEVLNVKAQRNKSVFTEPLNKQTAEWLEEIMTSPNVWVEMDTEATARGNTVNPFQRPSTKGYIPVIITNGDVETLNQESGLVKFNIEYTLAHKVQTQRN
jgi:hypothetical protein